MTADGRRWPYSRLLSTVPLDDLVAVTLNAPDGVRAAARSLVAVTARPGQTLLLAETSTSAHRPVPADGLVDAVLGGLRAVGLLASDAPVVTVWHALREKTYPVPTLGRDAALAVLQQWLGRRGIASRGRFGAWRYEAGNMDHSFMQGVAWADEVRSASGGEREQ